MTMPPAPAVLYVRFEQGRGVGGVPKQMVPIQGVGLQGEKATVETYVRIAVAMFRATCADAGLGHGKDLMPGESWEGYELHELEGGRVSDPAKVVAGEYVLTWRTPAALLAREV
jgi:hypothetical protein